MYLHRYFATSLLLSLFSFCYAQYNNDDVIKSEINRLGVNLGKSPLIIVDKGDAVSIYESKNRNSFFIIVNEEYRQYVSNPIIAYSATNGFMGTESAWKKTLLDYYSEQLKELKRQGSQIAKKSLPFRLFSSNQPNVIPLIKTIWGQDYPYNELCPSSVNKTTHNLTGCVATALSQMMFYYQYPAKGEGVLECGNGSGNYIINFDKQVINWNELKMSYPQIKTKGIDTKPIAELMSTNAKALSSQFNMINTAANFIAARSILINHWKYSPCCKFIKNTSMDMTTSIILDELGRNRPVLLAGGQHAFICDGYKDGFYHLNLGWNGAANGYYKFLVRDELKDVYFKNEIIREMLFDIRPATNNRFTSKEVNITAPGTLSNVLATEEKKYLKKLSVKGNLNGQDIALLRRMLGAADAWYEGSVAIADNGKWTGELCELDLHQASFVKDNSQPFLRIIATEGYFAWGKKEYAIGSSVNSDFENFLKTPLSHGRGYSYIIHDGKPFIEFYTHPNVVSPFMFYDCQNLKAINLPEDTRGILGNAFQWCSSLKSLSLPSKVKNIESGAFRECYLLQTVKVSGKITETKHHFFPFKTTGKYGEKDGCLHKGIFESNNIYTCKGLFLNNVRIEEIDYKVIY